MISDVPGFPAFLKLILKMVNTIVRSKYIFVENNNIEILFSNYIFRLTCQSPFSKSEYIVRK